MTESELASLWPDLLAKMGQMKMRPTKQNSGHSSSVPNDVVRVLDACVAINLAATGRPLREFAPPGGTLWLCRRAANGAVYLERRVRQHGRRRRSRSPRNMRKPTPCARNRRPESASHRARKRRSGPPHVHGIHDASLGHPGTTTCTSPDQSRSPLHRDESALLPSKL